MIFVAVLKPEIVARETAWLGVEGKIIRKWNGMGTWTEYIWIRIGASDGLP
jgi:hypothetical protein